MEEFLADEEIKNVYDKINDVERVALHKGEKKGIIKTAKNLLQLNIAIEDISNRFEYSRVKKFGIGNYSFLLDSLHFLD